MSQINVNRIKDSNEGAPDFPSGVNVGGITSTVTLGVTNLNPTNVNVSGVVTATTFDGSMSATGTPTLGLGVTINTSGLNISGVATAGIVSATTLYGDGTNITGIALTIAALNYNPAFNSQASHLTKASGIGLTFNQGVKAGSGNVTLSLANAGVAGTVVENFGVGNSVTYGDSDYGTTITITPTADLTALQDYHLSYPSGAFTNIGGDVSFVGTAYTFKGRVLLDELWSWGENDYGQLGQNSLVAYSSPVQVPGTTWNKSASGFYRTFAVKSDGTLWAWGSNENGCLGLNQAHDVSHRSSPTQIPGTTWSTVDSDVQSTIALKTDNTLWGWGNDDDGDMGQNSPAIKYSSPVQIPGTTWSKAFRGKNFNTAIKTDGTLWGWGTNYYGQLGQNTSGANSKYSSPVQVPGTTWATATASISVSHAIKTDGTLWSMGENHVGQLGLNSVISYSSPVQIPGTTWSTLSSSSYQALGIKTDGTLWTWGNNSKGQLGQNDVAQRSSPVQIPGTTWSATGHAMTASYGIKTDGTLWVWGYNTNGPLGQNNRTNYSSPVQVPGTWVTTARAAVQSGLNNEHLALLKNP